MKVFFIQILKKSTFLFLFFTKPYLNEDATYKLIVDVSEEAQPIEAETNLIIGSELNWDLLTSNGAIIMVLSLQMLLRFRKTII